MRIAEHLQQRFPDEMMIVIQHQFWDLEVHPRHFEIVLQFSGVPQHLEIPYAAVTRFHDPSVDFMMVFDQVANSDAEISEPVPTGPAAESVAPAAAEEEPVEEVRPASDGSVVQLDAFRRK